MLAEDAKEQKSLTAEAAKDANEPIIDIEPRGRKDNAKGGIQGRLCVILPSSSFIVYVPSPITHRPSPITHHPSSSLITHHDIMEAL